MTMFNVLLAILGFSAEATPGALESSDSTHAAVDSWLAATGTNPQRWWCPRDGFAQRLHALVDEPWRLYQGSYGWCLEAAFLHVMLRLYPHTVVQYGVALYDTGTATLGALRVEVQADLPNFDLPRYAAGELADVPLPQNYAGRAISYRHADWIMLAALVDYLHGPGVFRGPVSDSNGSPSLSVGDARKLLDGTELFLPVTDIDIEDPLGDFLPVVNDPNAAVILIASFNTLTQGLDQGTRHAAVLTAPIAVVENGQRISLKYWSWGESLPPRYAAIATAESEFSLVCSASDLEFDPIGPASFDGAFVVAVPLR